VVVVTAVVVVVVRRLRIPRANHISVALLAAPQLAIARGGIGGRAAAPLRRAFPSLFLANPVGLGQDTG
jgi:hypothetical protein